MKILMIYNSRGDAPAFLEYPHLFNASGEWIGFITAQREIYSVLGHYVGYLSDDHRILRARTLPAAKPRLNPPGIPPKANPPATAPLAPLMSELTQSTIDVLLEEPDRLHTLDRGELREDID